MCNHLVKTEQESSVKYQVYHSMGNPFHNLEFRSLLLLLLLFGHIYTGYVQFSIMQ